MFSSEEYTEMLIIYGESGRNANAAARLYRERFPNRLHPSSNVILRLINRVRSSGSVVPNRKGVGGIDRTVRTPNTEDEVLEIFNEDGTRSIRNVANTMGVFTFTDTGTDRDTTRHRYRHDSGIGIFTFYRYGTGLTPGHS
jgi:hypothetical protein